MLETLKIIVTTLWVLLPAYTPNNFAVVFGGGRPLDFGKTFFDGKRILGDGKTIKGFIAGIAGGMAVGNVQYFTEKILNFKVYTILPYQDFLIFSFLLSFGTMVGDAFGSFLKRRFGYGRGDFFPVVDQLTFLAVSLAFASLSPYFFSLFNAKKILIAVFITLLLHLTINRIAYKMGLKKVPW